MINIAVKSISFEIDDRFGEEYEYNADGEPIAIATYYIAFADISTAHFPSMKFMLEREDAQKIIAIVEAAANRTVNEMFK